MFNYSAKKYVLIKHKKPRDYTEEQNLSQPDEIKYDPEKYSVCAEFGRDISSVKEEERGRKVL